MTSTQYRPENSTRGKILYDKISPYIQDGAYILDIGCSYSPLSPHIRADFPKCQLFGFDSNGEIIKELRKTRPHYRWERILVDRGNELENYVTSTPDVVIHTGVNGAWSEIWTVHEWLFENGFSPQAALLETGYKSGYWQCMETYVQIIALYLQHRFYIKDFGWFDFDYEHATLKERHYCVLGK